MSFYIDPAYIPLNNPYPAGQTFRVDYVADNTGQADPGHDDYIQLTDSAGTKWIDGNQQAPPSSAGGRYGHFIDVPALQAGYYDLSVTLPDGTSAGVTIIVQ